MGTVTDSKPAAPQWRSSVSRERQATQAFVSFDYTHCWQEQVKNRRRKGVSKQGAGTYLVAMIHSFALNFVRPSQ